MFSRLALFTLVASAVAVSATAVPFAEHAPVVARDVEPTTTSTEIVYVTITRTIPLSSTVDLKVTAAPKLIGGDTHVNATSYLTNASGHTTATVLVNGTHTGSDGPKITEDTSSAAGLKVGSAMGLIGLALAFLL